MSLREQLPVGIDFGTTNSSVAVVAEDKSIKLVRFPFLGELTDAYRSLLYFELDTEGARRDVHCWTGPAGIERYLEADPKGRLIQSLKSFLSSHTLESTNVFGRQRTVEDLIARILADLRSQASQQFGIDIVAATVGRPVRFVGASEDDDNRFAESRLAEAFKIAGFERIEFELEPVAAAHHYESTLDHDELILIGDFGGGTSDFSLVRVGPAVRKRGRLPTDLLGTAGVGLAGDSFDAQIIKHLVSPALGAGSQQRSMGRLLSVPGWPYGRLERWHHLSFLKTSEVMSTLETIKWQALEPEKIEALIHLIKHDLGYQLHRAVQRVKCDLSTQRQARFHFTDGDLTIQFDNVYRSDFEVWIHGELTQIETCVDGLLQQCDVTRSDVDAVFLTGGSSFVPAVRRLFVNRFGESKIRTGHEFTSVAMGLAWKAADDARSKSDATFVIAAVTPAPSLIPKSPARKGSLDDVILKKAGLDPYHVSEYLRTGDWVFDVGANIGDFALLVQSLNPLTNIVCVEPIPDNFRVLEENVSPWARLEKAALVGTKLTSIVVHDFGLQNSGCHSIFSLGQSQARKVEVRAVTLESLLDKYNVRTVRFLKLDIQGAEYDVLALASSDILDRFDVIALEVHRYIAAGDRALGEVPAQPTLAKVMFDKLELTHVLKHGGRDATDCEQVWINRRLSSP